MDNDLDSDWQLKGVGIIINLNSIKVDNVMVVMVSRFYALKFYFYYSTVNVRNSLR